MLVIMLDGGEGVGVILFNDWILKLSSSSSKTQMDLCNDVNYYYR